MEIDEQQPAPDNLRAMLELATKVASSQRSCANATEQSLSKLEQELHGLVADLQRCEHDQKAARVMSKAAERIGKGVSKHLLDQTAPLHRQINSLKSVRPSTITRQAGRVPA
jgi:hypothetical protein